AREPPNQTAESARAKVVEATPCATDIPLVAVIAAAVCRPKIRTIRVPRTGAWTSRRVVQRSPACGAVLRYTSAGCGNRAGSALGRGAGGGTAGSVSIRA